MRLEVESGERKPGDNGRVGPSTDQHFNRNSPRFCHGVRVASVLLMAPATASDARLKPRSFIFHFTETLLIWF